MIIRKPEIDDIPNMIECIKQFMQDTRDGCTNHYANMPFIYNKLYHYILNCLNDDNVFTRVVMIDDKIVGGIQARLVEYFFNYEKLAIDEILYVDKKLKNKRIPLHLVTLYKLWVKDIGAKEAMLSNTTLITPEHFGRFANACGFENAGQCYKWRNE